MPAGYVLRNNRKALTMFAIVEELKSVLTINKAVRNGLPVYASILDRSQKERVKGARACPHLPKREVLTVFGWNHPVKVWSEMPVDSEADLAQAPPTGYLQQTDDAPTH